jgi:hypothetical protein
VSSRILPGAWLKIRISNSKVMLLNLGKSIENRRKIRKMQNQFCWTPDEKHNFW